MSDYQTSFFSGKKPIFPLTYEKNSDKYRIKIKVELALASGKN